MNLLTKEQFLTLTEDEQHEYLELLEEYSEYKRTHKALDFTPYGYQQEFYNAGKDYRIRLAMWGNRIGKTFSAAHEVGYHLTGLYPSWWTGHRFTKPIDSWAIGITGESTQNVLQKELLGTSTG